MKIRKRKPRFLTKFDFKKRKKNTSDDVIRRYEDEQIYEEERDPCVSAGEFLIGSTGEKRFSSEGERERWKALVGVMINKEKRWRQV